jgi:starch synthase
MRVLFATAELAPIAAVGGLAQASAGLVRQLRSQGVDVEVVLPDYHGVELTGEELVQLDVPAWAHPASARRGEHPTGGSLTLVTVPGIQRQHPYLDASGVGWPDNDARFLGFSAAVAALARATRPDVVHLNDWHTAAAAADIEEELPVVLTVHNLAYQGQTGAEWLERLGPRGAAYARDGGCNPLAGGIALADIVVVVSPTYREEVLRPETGAGFDALLRERAGALVGIRNGIDVDVWDPSRDQHIPAPFGPSDRTAKALARAALLARLDLPERAGPLAVAVTRLVEQKGIDLLLPLVPGLEEIGLQVGVLGSGDASLAEALRAAAALHPTSLGFIEGYDEPLSHLMLAGGDLLLMPSRFEPCGLAQMQAMRYGTLPVVTDVGGLHDTVVDLDEDPDHGTGWRAGAADASALQEALVRAVRGWADPAIRTPAQFRGMTADWSWAEPATRHVELYRRLADR